MSRASFKPEASHLLLSTDTASQRTPLTHSASRLKQSLYPVLEQERLISSYPYDNGADPVDLNDSVVEIPAGEPFEADQGIPHLDHGPL